MKGKEALVGSSDPQALFIMIFNLFCVPTACPLPGAKARNDKPANCESLVRSCRLNILSSFIRTQSRFALYSMIPDGGTLLGPCYKSIPAMEADIKFAMVPASMARSPSRASSPFLLGASAPIPPI